MRDPAKDTERMLGDPKKAILATVLPFLISIAVGQINMLADLAWCSGLGSDSVSAMQSVVPLYWVVFDVGLGIGLGCNVVISHRIGFGDIDGARRVIAQGVVLSLAIAMVMAPIVFLLIDPMVSWMGAPELAEAGTAYLAPILAFGVFQVLSPTLSGFLRGEGAANKSNLAMIIGTLFNIVADPLLIFGLDMGIAGAGLATGISCAVSVSAMLFFYLSGRTTVPLSLKGYRFSPSDAREILRLGLPKMSEMFLMDSLDAINRAFLIACGGVDAVTVFSVPFRLVMLAAFVPNAFAMAMTPVASANIGAGRPDKSAEAFYFSLKCAMAASIGLTLVYLVAARFLLIPFTMSGSMEPLLPQLVEVLRVESLMAPLVSMTFVCNSMLQSMRMPMRSLGVTVLRTVLTTSLFALLCGTTVTIMCAGMVAAGAVAAAAALYMTRRSVGRLVRSHRSSARRRSPSPGTAARRTRSRSSG